MLKLVVVPETLESSRAVSAQTCRERGTWSRGAAGDGEQLRELADDVLARVAQGDEVGSLPRGERVADQQSRIRPAVRARQCAGSGPVTGTVHRTRLTGHPVQSRCFVVGQVRTASRWGSVTYVPSAHAMTFTAEAGLTY